MCTFREWESCFTNGVAGVKLTAPQEMDLMIKYLGKKSGEQVRSVGSVYIKYQSGPAKGVGKTV